MPILSALHENKNAAHNDEYGQKEEVKKLNFSHSVRIQFAILRCLRPDRNQIFVVREPVHNVQSKVEIFAVADAFIGNKSGCAYNNEAAIIIGLAG